MSKRSWYRRIEKATKADIEDIRTKLQDQIPQTSSHEISEDNCPIAIECESSYFLNNTPTQNDERECAIDLNNDLLCDSSFGDSSHRTDSLIQEGMLLPSHMSDLDLLDGNVQSIAEKEQRPLDTELARWALNHNITHVAVSDLLKIFHKSHPELPLDARTLLGTSRDIAPVEKMGSGLFLYLGLAEGLKNLLVRTGFSKSEVSLKFNIDGQSPYKGSKLELWPVLCKVDGICHKPFIVCAYYGRGKPKSAEDFTAKFVEELAYLVQNGLQIDLNFFHISVSAFICDFPAMAFIKSILGSKGFLSCSKCFVVGMSIARTTVFYDVNAKLRTDENFRAQEQPGHHKGNGCLLKLSSLDMLKAFPLDSMHVIYINVVKKLCNRWRNGINRFSLITKRKGRKEVTVFKKKLRRKNAMSDASVSAVDKRIATINKYMPSDFARKLSAFSEAASWKATEARQFILYTAPVIMKGILSLEQYEHMILLHFACRIMSSENFCQLNLDLAEQLLKSFVSKCKYVLGIDFTSQAVHSLIHLPADCKVHGCLDTFSAFPFESFQGELKTLLRSYARPLQQLWKRLSEQDTLNVPVLESTTEVVSRTRIAKHCFGPTCGLDGEHYSRLCFRGKMIALNGKDNTLCLEDGSIIKANNLIRMDSKWFVIGQMFNRCEDFYSKSSLVSVWKVSGLTSQNFHWPLELVCGKAALVPYKHYFVCMKLLHC